MITFGIHLTHNIDWIRCIQILTKVFYMLKNNSNIKIHIIYVLTLKLNTIVNSTIFLNAITDLNKQVIIFPQKFVL